MLYALPSQADEVAEVGRQLGLSTILAIGQILDHTAARMRVSMHGRTLVEMAIVRICQLGELDDLAALIAELRGTTGEPPVEAAAARKSSRRRSTCRLPSQRRPQKKTLSQPVDASCRHAAAQPVHAKARAASTASNRQSVAPIADQRVADDPPHVAESPPIEATAHPTARPTRIRPGPMASEQWPNGGTRQADAAPPRTSRASNWPKSPSSRSFAARWNCSTCRRTDSLHAAGRRSQLRAIRTEPDAENTEK